MIVFLLILLGLGSVLPIRAKNGSIDVVFVSVAIVFIKCHNKHGVFAKGRLLHARFKELLEPFSSIVDICIVCIVVDLNEN